MTPQDQARRMAEEERLPEIDHRRWTEDQIAFTKKYAREAIAEALVKLTQGQEPVAWERRLKFPQAPGAVGEWEKCGKTEATSMFDSSPLHEYRCLYTHSIPSQQEERKPQYHCVGFIDGYGTLIMDKSDHMKAPQAVYIKEQQ